MKVTIYQYPTCSTCRDAMKQLKEKGYEVERIHIVEDTPSAAQLKVLVKHSGLDIKRFFNVNGQVYREMKLKDKLDVMSDDEKLALLASNGMLIKRPIVTDGKRVTVGFNKDDFERW